MNTHSRVHGAVKKERESFWMLCVYVYVYVSRSPSDHQGEDPCCRLTGEREVKSQ